MANGLRCKHCGYQETDHDSTIFDAIGASTEKRRAIQKCGTKGGFTLTKKNQALNTTIEAGLSRSNSHPQVKLLLTPLGVIDITG